MNNIGLSSSHDSMLPSNVATLWQTLRDSMVSTQQWINVWFGIWSFQLVHHPDCKQFNNPFLNLNPICQVASLNMLGGSSCPPLPRWPGWCTWEHLRTNGVGISSKACHTTLKLQAIRHSWFIIIDYWSLITLKASMTYKNKHPHTHTAHLHESTFVCKQGSEGPSDQERARALEWL